MNKIASSLKPGMQDAAVADLQDGLLLLIDNKQIELSDKERDKLLAGLKDEWEKSYYGESTANLVVLFRQQHSLNDQQDVDEKAADVLNSVLEKLGAFKTPIDPVNNSTFVVSGVVRDSSGKLLTGVVVRANMRELGADEQLVGETKSNDDGSYAIPYDSKQFRRGKEGSVQVRVTAVNGKGEELASKEDIFRLGSKIELDLTLPAAPPLPEWVRIDQAIRPVLADHGKDGKPLDPTELNETDIEVLAKDTSIDQGQIRLWVQAFKLAQTTRLLGDDPQSNEQESAIYYGWFRQGLPITYDEFMKLPTVDLVKAFLEAVNQNIIASNLRELESKLRTALENRLIDDAIRPANAGQPATLGNILMTNKLLLDTNIQKSVASVLREVTFNDEQFAAKLATKGLKPDQITVVERTLRLSDLTGQNVPLVAELQQATGADAKSDLVGLAKLTPIDWLGHASEFGVPANMGISPSDYALKLQTAVEDLHPTATLKARLEQDRFKVVPSREKVMNFLNVNPDFDIVKTNLDTYLGKSDKPEDVELHKALKPIQQLKRLSASWDEAQQLMSAGIWSPGALLDAGPEGTALALGTEELTKRAVEMHANATKLNDMAVALMGNSLKGVRNIGVTVLPNQGGNIDLSLLEDFPTLQQLFGDLDECACDPCLSVLSPAAYFVDLLQFLRKTGSDKGDSPAYVRLTTRRPDLLDMELSCENTETEVPQVDLALEILENTVVLPINLTFQPGTDVVGMLTTPGLGMPLRDLVQSTTLQPLSNSLVAAKGDFGDWGANWTLTDQGKRWTLRQREEGFIIGRFTTNDTVEEIRLTTNPSEHSRMLEALNHLTFPDSLTNALFQPSLTEKLYYLQTIYEIQHVTTYGVEIIEADRDWLMIMKRVVRVRIFGATMTVETLSGRVLSTVSFSRGEQQGIADNFNQAVISKDSMAVFRNTLRFYMDEIDYGMSKMIFTREQDASGSLLGVWRIEGQGVFPLNFYPDQLEIAALSYQSSRPETNPLSESEYRNPAAYTVLARAPFPWTLPLDLPLEETRRFLEQAGVSRLRLMELMISADPWSPVRLNSSSIAKEIIGLTPAEAKLITTPATAPQIWEYWGFHLDATGKVSMHDTFSGDDYTELPFDLVRRVSILLQQTRLSFEELWEVLQTRFVSGGTKPLILPEDECKPSQMIAGLLPEYPDCIHRFLRLKRQLGWTIQELDQSLEAAAHFGSDFSFTLVFLSQLKRLHIRIGLSVEVLAAWWLERASTDQHSPDQNEQEIKGLYERVFLNPSVQNPPNSSFELNPDRRGLKQENPATKIEGMILRLVAASLGTQSTSIVELLAYARELSSGNHPTLPNLPSLPGGLPSIDHPPIDNDLTNSLTPDSFTLGNLMRLYRETTLCRALGLSTTDYVRLRRISGIDPFTKPEMTLVFCDLLEMIRSSSFSVSDLAYLLLNELGDISPFVLTSQHRNTILDELLAAIRMLKAQLLNNGVQDSEINSPLDDRITSQLATAFQLDSATIRELLTQRLQYTKDGTAQPSSAIEAFRDPVLLDNQAGNSAQTGWLIASNLLTRLHKSAILLKQFELTMPRLNWFEDNANQHGFLGINFNDLPVATVNSCPPNLFQGWRRFYIIQSVRRYLSESSLANYIVTLVSSTVVETFKISRVVDIIAQTVSVASSEVNSIANRLGMNTGSSYLDPIQLAGLLELAIALKRLGVTESEAKELANDVISTESSLLARKILHAKFGTQASGGIKPISDKLRIRQRDALVDYLMYSEKLDDANQLYEYFLIDPQSSPRLKTTRLLQATQSVQLFVQRCLLNLELGITLTTVQRRRWEWMKNYRVWEANRKVFLFPENWLYPELREDKTAVFRELEGSLTQTEVDPTTPFTAANKFVETLGSVAKIHVLGIHQDIDSHTLYVVGRTPNDPGQYFWRTCIGLNTQNMHWTGWEPINLNVSGNHLIPFVLEGRPAIAWPNFKKISNSGGDFWEVALQWTTRSGNTWDKPIVIDNILRNLPVRVIPGKDENGTFAFRISERDASVSGLSFLTNQMTRVAEIECYVAEEKAVEPTFASTFQDASMFQPITVEAIGSGNLRGQLPVTVNVYMDAMIHYIKGEKDYRPISDLQVGWYPINVYTPQQTFTVLNTHTDSMGKVMWAFSIAEMPIGIMFATSYGGNTYACYVSFPQIKDANKKPIGYSGSYNVNLGLYHHSSETPPPKPAIAFDENVSMAQKAVVSIPNLREGTIRDGDETQKLPSLDGTYHWGNGYREQGGVQSDAGSFKTPWSGNAALFGATPGLFDAITDIYPRNSQHVLWYRDDYASYLYIQQDNSSPRLLTEGTLAFRDSSVSVKSEFVDIHDIQIQLRSDNGSVLTTRSPGISPYNDPSHIDVNTPEKFHFNPIIPFSIYNWELFFHTPWLIADYLSKQQRFSEAQNWLHFIFNPTTDEKPDVVHPYSHYWKVLPFRENDSQESITTLLEQLTNPNVTGNTEDKFRASVEIWKDQPFRPHVIAQMRTSAYQWRILFTYLDNLIAWGDQQFTRDTRESINEAIQLYVLAANILGRRPRFLNRKNARTVQTFRSLIPRLETEFSDAWLPLADQAKGGSGSDGGNSGGATDTLRSLGYLYFCVPFNEKLVEYWDKIEDRLFKIRNSLNIDGILRELSLFDPPIDPELLVRATAAGLDIGEILTGMTTPMPKYRFLTLSQKATELCNEVKALGGALLSAIEKRDAEHLSLLRSSHEIELLQLVQTVRQSQRDEAEANAVAIRQNRIGVAYRYEHMQRLLGRSGVKAPQEGQVITFESINPQIVPSSSLWPEQFGLGIIQSEQSQLARMIEAQIFGLLSGSSSVTAGVFHTIAGALPEPKWIEATARGFEAGATTFKTMAEFTSAYGSRDAIVGGYERRRDEWISQSNQALKELQQIDKQLVAADIRAAIAKKELDNTAKQIEQSSEVNEFVHSKYTNEQLYSWMESQLAGTYFRAYQLAHEVAKRAERGMAFDLNINNNQYIQCGYWDSMKKGLLAGERLLQDIKRMEVAYLDLNRRDYELTKHVSLSQLKPIALLQLRMTGQCDIALPEELFDMDGPGHYLRRIKSVALSIPCVAGPYTSVNCTLTLKTHSIRKNDGQLISDPLIPPEPSIVTSFGQNDSGLFETNLHDERYLPFEGYGVISSWTLQLPGNPSKNEPCQFDYDTIADAILHIRYTAQEGGDTLRTAAIQHLKTKFATENKISNVRLFSVRHDFPTEWAKFTNIRQAENNLFELSLKLEQEHYPFWSKDYINTIQYAFLYAGFKKSSASVPTEIKVAYPFDDTKDEARQFDSLTGSQDEKFGALLHAQLTKLPSVSKSVGMLTIYLGNNEMKDLWLAVTW